MPPALTTGLYALAGGVVGFGVGAGASVLAGERPKDSSLVGLSVFLGLLAGAALGGQAASSGTVSSGGAPLPASVRV
jgi:hypothetical protein